jgi:hypothetical protein
MTLTTVDITTSFQFNIKFFGFTDTTDYAGQGVNLADVDGVFKIISPDGATFYNNTDFGNPDIDPDVSLNFLLALPLDGSGNVMQGTYTITYSVQDSSGAPFVVDTTKVYVLDYTTPEVDIEMTVDCLSPLLTSTDVTAYPVINGINPTLDRDINISYPPSVNQPSVSSSSGVVQTSTFYTVSGGTLEHSSYLISAIDYDLGGGFLISDEIEGGKVIQVSCDGLCEAYCCMKSEWSRYEKAISSGNSAVVKESREILSLMAVNAELARIAMECGKGNDVEGYLVEIQELGSCSGDCDCDDGTPTLVTGLVSGSGGNSVVEAGNGMVVTSVDNGTFITYTVSLPTATTDKINNSFNSTVDAGNNVTVDVVVNGDEKIFTVNAVVGNVLSFIANIDLTPAAPNFPSYTIESETIAGTLFQTPTVFKREGTEVYATWLNGSSYQEISGFQIAPTDDYKVSAEIVELNYVPTLFTTQAFMEKFGRAYVAEIRHKESGLFRFRISDPSTGAGLTNNDSQDLLTSIKVAITITE